jgi:YidC/Oxa1 family membrane protein insertase
MVFQQLPAAVLYGRAFEDGLLEDVDVYRAQPGDVAERGVYEGQFTFAGVDNHYFAAVALPGPGETRVDYRAVSTVNSEHDLVAFDLTVDDGVAEIPMFIGPKDFDILAVVHPDLVRVIDFGWLSMLVVPLHRTLKWIYGFLGNYGWSIILLTVLINIVIFPLRHKSVVSMRKMQELQPEMKAIQARYADLKATDPGKQKMNQEVMELYRKHGANPASGCLPMLLTMPILFAFYRLLSMAIEIRGAPFMFWITDLSMHDPFYVTPVVMGASMVVQQRLQPSAADPTQQKIMMMMPVMFTFMFLWAPGGLVIYWLTSNVIGIGQTLITNRIAGPPRSRQVRPPAERQVKKAVAAKTIDVEPVASTSEGPEPASGRARQGGKRDRQGKGGGRRSRGRGTRGEA